MPKAIVVEKTGSPSVMKWRDSEVGRPGKGEVTVRAKAIGVNFIDIYQRSGLYPMPLPFTPAEGIFNVPAKCPAVMNAHAGSGIPSSCLLGGEGILGFEL